MYQEIVNSGGVTKFVNEDGEVRYGFNPTTHDVVNKAQKEGYKKKLKQEEYKLKYKGKDWVACYHEPIKIIIKEHILELNELGALLKLLPYMQFKKDGLLIKEGRTMTMKEIEGIIGTSTRQTKRIIKRLVEKALINREGNNRNPKYIVNNRYHTMGAEIQNNMKFTKLFNVETRKRTKDISLHEAGLLYKILPWFHYESYYLCSNPYEPSPEEIHHLNHKELSECIGEDERTVYRHLQNLMRKGFIMQLKGYGGAVIYKVNPDIMFRNKEDKLSPYTDTVRRDFLELARKFEKEII
jgi:predicted transcriptional regulator